jgi:hypothetical protein
MKKILSVVAGIAGVCCALQAQDVSGLEESEAGGIQFDAGADLRIRQEIVHNQPQLGGVRGRNYNHMRFRPRVWGELKMGGSWRLYTRLADEFRYGIRPHHAQHNNTFPGEVVLDNLFVEGRGLFDGFLDLKVGRQDIYHLYGLDHIFVDGTAGDGSRTQFSDMAAVALHVDEESWIDLFALYNQDHQEFRWGTKRSHHLRYTNFSGRNEPEMDDWGFGAIWNSKLGLVDYKLLWIQKNTAAFHDAAGVKHPSRQVNLLGTKIEPRWTDSFSTPLELYGQVGQNGRGNALRAWSAYAGFDWKGDAASFLRPFATGGVLFQSGDKNAAAEDGGRGAWDPMWYRGVDDSEMFLYGPLYGAGWWSNQINLKTTAGVIFGPHHKVQLMIGPIFAETRDGLGGGDGQFKGFLSQARYDFPLWLADASKGDRFEIFGHLLFECFNPGDYYETSKPAYFVRWQVDFRF